MAAPPNSVDRQILDLRDLFTQLEQRYVALVANFQMLRPLLDNDLLKERMDDPSKRLGAVAIATALFNACVLDACALLRMPRRKERLKIGQYPNLALADAIKPFLPKNRTKNGVLIDQLSKERLNRAAHSPSQYSKTKALRSHHKTMMLLGVCIFVAGFVFNLKGTGTLQNSVSMMGDYGRLTVSRI
jgi:hypothetical protein